MSGVASLNDLIDLVDEGTDCVLLVDILVH